MFTDWTALDSLAVTRFQTYLLSYDVDADLYFQRVLDSARGTFTAADPDPLLAARAGIERDLWQFAPADPASPMTGYPGAMKSSGSKRRKPGPAARPDRSALLGTVAGYLEAHRTIKDAIAPDGFGSNGWVLGPSLSATGHALLASDPHLQLALPAVFWPVSIEVLVPEGGDTTQAMKVAGVAFPGIPGVALGHNEHIAWGATVAGYDVADAYAETLTPDAKSVMLNGSPVALTSVDEVIQIKGSEPYTYSVKIVPHHGPILPNLSGDKVLDPDPAVGAMSVRWTGLEPTEELAATLGILRASSASEAKSALAKFRVGAQNWMIADTAGDILWTSSADIPIRDPNAFAWSNATFTGNLPCLVLPGDGTAEWKGTLADDLIPGLTSPAAGYILTANADPIGDTADNDPSNGSLPDGTPMYLHCSFNIGFRQGRLRTLIEEHPGPFAPEELAALQADVRSPLGASITPRILDVIDRAEEERTTPGSHPDLTAIVSDPAYDPARVAAARAALDAWGKEADFAATSGLDAATNTPLPADGSGPEAMDARASRATLLFNVWLVRALRRTFADEYIKMGFPTFNRVVLAKAFLHLLSADPATLATFDPAAQDSALWDDLATPAVESRDEQMIRALLDTFAWFDENVAGDPVKERWGAHHTVTFGSALPTVAKATFPPSDDPVFPGGFPRPGDEFAVDHAEFPLTFAGDGPPKFRFASGAAQRLVVDLDPAGPRAWNAFPGGAVWDPASPHYQDSAALWRRNETRPVAFLLPDVIAVKESRTVLAAP